MTSSNKVLPITAHVSTHELSNGDIVWTHGARLRLRDRAVYADNGPGGDVIAFHVDCLNDGGAIPRHWLFGATSDPYSTRYTIQGNSFARWSREVAQGGAA